MERVAGQGLDGHDPDAAAIPGGDAADQAAAPNRHQQRIEIGHLVLEFAGKRALALQRRFGIVGVNAKRSGCGDMGFAQGEGFVISRTLLHDPRAIGGDLGHFRGRGNLRHEDQRLEAELLGGIGHRRAVISPRCRGNAGLAHLASGESVEGAPRFETSRMLQMLELQRHRLRNAIDDHVDHRSAPDMGRDAVRRDGDAVAVDAQAPSPALSAPATSSPALPSLSAMARSSTRIAIGKASPGPWARRSAR